MKVVLAAFKGFRSLEVRQNVIKRPARQPHLTPLIIVTCMATNIQHAIDRRGAAKPFTTGPKQTSPIHVLLRCCPESPVVSALFAHQITDTCGHADEQASVLSTRFNQRHLDVWIFGQSSGQRTACAPCPDNDVVHCGMLTRRSHDVLSLIYYYLKYYVIKRLRQPIMKITKLELQGAWKEKSECNPSCHLHRRAVKRAI